MSDIKWEYAQNVEPLEHVVLAKDYEALHDENIDLTRQVSALQLSHDNIINSLGIKGDGPVSKLVIEYVMGLVAESVALKEYIREECFVTPPHTTILTSKADVPAEDFMPETANTAAAIAEISAKAVEEFASSVGAEAEGLSPSSKEYKSIKSTVFRAVKFAANLRAGRKG